MFVGMIVVLVLPTKVIENKECYLFIAANEDENLVLFLARATVGSRHLTLCLTSSVSHSVS